MSRFERDFEAGDVPPGAAASEQRDAIACYLSAGEGWNEALKALRGAFANQAVATSPADGKAQDKQEINHRTSEYLQWPAFKSAGNNND